jgi:short-subunit dehydrogenase
MNVLITGAVQGIGYSTALELLNRGHFVYLSVHTEQDLEEVKEKQELVGKNVQFLKLDITNEEDRNKAKDLDIDVLINNAAVPTGGSIIEASMERIRETFEVNFFATLEMTQLYLEEMVMRNSGRIINISSMLGDMPTPWMGIYASSKAALTNLTVTLAKELNEIGSKVKAITIEPGYYHTGFNQEMSANKFDNPESLFKNLKEEIKKKEELKLDLLESKDLASIANTIVKAVESPRPRKVYKAPLIQAIMEKTSMIKNK